MQQYQNPFGNFPQPAPTGDPQQPGIAPAGAGAPFPGATYGAPAPGYPPQHQYGAPAPAGFAQPMPFGDPFAAVATANLTRGQKLFYRGPDIVLAEVLRTKLTNGQKGVAFVVETRVLWSAKGANTVGSEPSVVLKQASFYFGAEVKTWMCGLLGLVAGRDAAQIAQFDATQGQWSSLCSLACASGDGRMDGPGPFAGTILLLDCYRKLKVDRNGRPKVLQQGEDPEIDLVRPEAVSQSVGDALRYLRACTNPAQDPQAERHYGVVKAALERRLPVPAFDPNALSARIAEARGGAPAAPSQPAPAQAPQPGYGAPAKQAPGYGGPGYGPQPGTLY